MNILLDDLPTDYNGYLINYSFRSGILVAESLSDDSIQDEKARVLLALRCLFGRGIPPLETAMEGLRWFLSGGNDKRYASNTAENLFSFIIDQELIYSAFMVKYQIDLNREPLHYFKFLTLFSDLGGTTFQRVVGIRSTKPKDLKNYSKEYKNEMMRLKKEFSLNQVNKFNSDEQKAIDHFESLLKG